jgi:hypothetical protein
MLLFKSCFCFDVEKLLDICSAFVDISAELVSSFILLFLAFVFPSSCVIYLCVSFRHLIFQNQTCHMKDINATNCSSFQNLTS